LIESNVTPLIAKYEDQLERDPRSRVFAPLAEAYRKVGLIENAFKVLQKGIRYNPDYLLGYLTLAQCYIDKGEYPLSYSTLRPLAPLHRDNIRLQNLFAVSAEKTGNKSEALDTFKYLLFLQPKDDKVAYHVQRLEKELGESALYEEKAEEEIQFDIDALKPSPELDRALDDWVQVDLNQEQEEDFEEWSTEVKKIDEEPVKVEVVEKPLEVEEVEATPVITHTLVDLYLQQGHKEKALELLEKIAEIQPENKDTQKRLEELKKEVVSPNEEEGRSILMAAIDLAQKTPREEEVSEPQESVESITITTPLEEFLTELKSRSKPL
jgi:tetratricopeptide (TPR) repeat protein